MGAGRFRQDCLRILLAENLSQTSPNHGMIIDNEDSQHDTPHGQEGWPVDRRVSSDTRFLPCLLLS